MEFIISRNRCMEDWKISGIFLCKSESLMEVKSCPLNLDRISFWILVRYFFWRRIFSWIKSFMYHPIFYKCFFIHEEQKYENYWKSNLRQKYIMKVHLQKRIKKEIVNLFFVQILIKDVIYEKW